MLFGQIHYSCRNNATLKTVAANNIILPVLLVAIVANALKLERLMDVDKM